MTRLLPLADEPAPERADAARNREALLAAALRLVETRGVDCVTMDTVAAEAGVGKGTVFRRFESREGLMAALLNHSETQWQASVISGPPPLGPGAPPMERLLAFGHSRLRTNLTARRPDRAAGRAGTRSYAAISFATMHVRHLLARARRRRRPAAAGHRAAGAPGAADAPAAGGPGADPGRAARGGWDDLVRRVVG